MAAICVDGFLVLFDDQDLARIEGLSLRVHQQGSESSPLLYVEFKRNGRTCGIHRFLMGSPAGMVVDHRNGDGLDNRRENLRVCTHAQNMQNRRMHSNNTTGVKGVYFDKNRQTFRVAVRAFGRKVSVGSFSDLASAAEAYRAAAERLHGPFSRAT